ncbi:hypothetical protein [Vibrio mediterranei]|uniref:hypothetical protein n=1 Tax=Vibrio mediterranei TaxID=689 RepID=UPI003C13036D
MLGEQGRSFRSFRSFVVATEVRNIVCRTQQSIKEILEMMGNLQSGSQHASVALQEVVAPFRCYYREKPSNCDSGSRTNSGE